MTMILDGTNGAFLPTWTTATRPASPANGEIGYNSTTGQLDQYVSGAWSSVPTAGASQATATSLGTVYAKQTTGGGSPYTTAFGYNAGVSTTGASCVAIGTQALFNNGSGYDNTAVGYQTLYTNSLSTGVSLTAIGVQAGYSYNSGGSNQAQVYVGSRAGYYNVTGIDNTYVGGYAGYQATGSYNTAVGSGALSVVTASSSGSNNTAVGYQAFYKCTTPNAGTAVGYQAGFNRTTAPNSTAFGYQALYNETTANGTGWNTALGNGALSGCTVGYYNLAVGGNAGNTVVDGAANIFIGTFAAASATNVQYENVLGGLTGKGNNTLYVAGSSGAYNQANSSSWSTTSDRRLKKNIVDNTIGLDAINAIQVRNFEYRTEDEITELPKHAVIKKEGVQIGAIAQELQQVLPDCVKTESTGVMSVDTTNITWHLINAVKELSAELNALKAKVGA
jgi:hypothetical protein